MKMEAYDFHRENKEEKENRCINKWKNVFGRHRKSKIKFLYQVEEYYEGNIA